MPNKQPIVSYTRIRDYAEKFTWFDPKTNQRQIGYNPPADAVDTQRVPFHIKVVTEKGHLLEGEVICVGVNTGLHMRNLLWTDTKETHWVSDLFVIEIDGVRFNTH